MAFFVPRREIYVSGEDSYLLCALLFHTPSKDLRTVYTLSHFVLIAAQGGKLHHQEESKWAHVIL